MNEAKLGYEKHKEFIMDCIEPEVKAAVNAFDVFLKDFGFNSNLKGVLLNRYAACLLLFANRVAPIAFGAGYGCAEWDFIEGKQQSSD